MNGGNVGIGTTNPGEKLDVYNSDSTGLRSIGTAALSTGSGGGAVLATSFMPTAADQRIGVLSFSAYNTDVSTWRYGASVAAYSSEAWAANTNQGTYLTFSTTTTNGGNNRLERVRIDPAGNVGITLSVPHFTIV